jgi:O-antigen/teichoic acid export membrane protein
MSKLKLAWNSLSGAGMFFTDASVSLIMTPIIVRELGRRDYGLWELMLSVVGYLGILDLGMAPAVIRHVAHAESKGDAQLLNRVFNTGIVALCGAGIIGASVIAILAIWGDSILGLSPGEVPFVGLLFGLFAAHLVLGFFLSSIVAFVMGLQYHRLINGVRMCTTLIQAFCIYQVLNSGGEPALIYMSITVLGINTLQSVIFFTWILRTTPVKLDMSSVSLQTARELITFGLKSTLLMAAGSLVKRATLFVTAHVVGVAAIAYFVIPNRLAEYAQALSLALGFPLTPYFTSLTSTGGIASAREAWLPITRALQLVALGMPVAVMWLGVPFLHRWMGAEYAENGRVVLYILCTALLFQGVACNGNRLLMSMGKHGRVATMAAVLAPVAVVASVYLGRLWGIVGIATAVASYIAVQAMGELYFACRELQLPIRVHLRGTVGRYLLPIALCCLAFWLMRRIEVPASYPAILVQGAVAGLVYLIAAFFFALESHERRSMIAWVARRAGRDIGSAA